MNSTLSAMDQKKRATWKEKVNDRSNIALTEKVNSEKQRLKDDLANERSKMKQEYAHDLTTHKHYNSEKRAREQRARNVPSKGFDFE